MEPSSKRATGAAADRAPSESKRSSDDRLSDFLSGGLRESQRPPASSRSSVPTPKPEVEATAPVEISRAEADPLERAQLAESGPLHSPVQELPPTGPDAPDAPTSSNGHDDARASERALVADESVAGSEPEYVVPVGLPSRSRIVAIMIGTALMGIAVIWWLSRDGKAPLHAPNASPAAPVRITHEPLPPPPPPAMETSEPSAATDEELAPQDPSAVHAPAGATSASEPNGATPFGPSVARFPDLPTPVLIELEQAQQEKQDKKRAK